MGTEEPRLITGSWQSRSMTDERDVNSLLDAGITHDFKQPAFAGCDDGTLASQPMQGDTDFLLVHAADPVGQHVDFVSLAEKIQDRLSDADVRLDTHYGDLVHIIFRSSILAPSRGRDRGKVGRDRRNPH